jgi:hypothetical protein
MIKKSDHIRPTYLNKVIDLNSYNKMVITIIVDLGVGNHGTRDGFGNVV